MTTVKDSAGEPLYRITNVQDITERKRAEERLHVFERMVSVSRDMMAVVDRDHRCRIANEAYAAAYGMTVPGVVGRDISALLGGRPFEETVRPQLSRCLAGEEVRQRAWFTFPDGERFLDIAYSPFRDASERITGVAISARDITEFKGIETRIETSEARLAAIFEQAGEAIFIVRPNEGRMVEFNSALCGILGYTDEELRRLPISEIDALDDEVRVRQRMERILKNGEERFSTRWRTKAGEIRYIENHVRLMTIGGDTMLLGTAHDNTELYLAKQDLQEERNLFIAGPTVVFRWKMEVGWPVEYVSPNVEAVFGYSPSQMLDPAQGFADLIHPEDIPRFGLEISGYLEDQNCLFFEQHYRLRHIDGDYRHVYDMTTVVRNAVGGVAGLNGYLLDITERVRNEDRLRQAKRQAETANRAKSAFLANMSHELRTPLNAVLGYAQIMQRDPGLSTEQRHHAEAIARSGDYLLVLINDILDLAKIEAGRFELLSGACRLPRFFTDLAEVFELRARQKGLALHSRIAADLPALVEVDEKRLRQVCMNLLSNAVKFTELGTVTLEADYVDGRLRVAVTDTGMGIPTERVATLFEPFVQAGEDAYRQQGTGLGLAISRSLVQQMGGDIEVESREWGGSRVFFSVPLVALESRAPVESDLLPGSVAGYRRTDGKEMPLRILVVDDNEDNRYVLAAMLEPVGFQVGEAEGGGDAVAQIGDNRPDLVLMDLVMPGMNGLEATRAIHAIPGLDGLPVIAVSARTFAEDRAECLAAGCLDHIGKPVVTTTLLEVLARHLPISWIEAQGAVTTQPGEVTVASRTLPEGALGRLQEAVVIGSSTRIEEALDAIRGHDEALGEILARWVDAYQYERILALSEDGLSTATIAKE